MSAIRLERPGTHQRLTGWGVTQRVFVALTAAAAALFMAYNVARFDKIGEPFGLVLGPGGTILDANPTARAILSPREPVDLSMMTLRDRLSVASTAIRPYRGQIVRIYQGLPGHSHEVVVRVKRASDERVTQLMIVAETFGSGVFLAIATLLAFRRPGPMTWYLLTYAAGLPSQYKITAGAPHWMLILAQLLQGTFGTFMPYGLLLFACFFPGGRPKTWLAYCVPIVLVVGLLDIAVTLFADVSLFYFGIPSVAWDDAYALYRALEVALPIGICAVFLTTYVVGRPAVRQRVKWLIVGALVTQAVYSFDAYWSYYVTSIWSTQWTLVGAELAAMSIPAFFGAVIAYVVLRYNVIDVGLAISRTFVLGLLCAFMVVGFAVIEWFVGQELLAAAAALVLDACVALLGAYVFAVWTPQLEGAIDAVFFRRRRSAESRLRAEIEALQSVRSEAALYSHLADAPVRALDLMSSVVFTLQGEDIRVVRTIGLRESLISKHINLHAVAARVRSKRRTASIADLTGIMDEEAEIDLPVAAMPLNAGRRLTAFALYGAHRTGEDFDEAERRNLDAFGRAAAAVYERLEVEKLRGEILAASVTRVTFGP